MPEASACQIRDRSSKRQVQAFDIRRIELHGSLRALQGFVQSPPRSNCRSSFDLDHAIVSPGFDHVPIDAGHAEELADDASRELETVGGELPIKLLREADRVLGSETANENRLMKLADFAHFQKTQLA